jgi:hypothetical protein
MCDIYLLMATGTAAKSDHHSYPAGERHALLLFNRQDDMAKVDYNLVAERGRAAGWVNVRVEQVAVINKASMAGKDEICRQAYEDAVADGFHVVVFTDPLDDESYAQ